MIVARVLAEPSGERIGIIRLAEYPANCAWGGADHQTMFFTANTSIYRLRMKTPAIPIPRASQASG
jgi:sugar lactone lactonase YvrE